MKVLKTLIEVAEAITAGKEIYRRIANDYTYPRYWIPFRPHKEYTLSLVEYEYGVDEPDTNCIEDTPNSYPYNGNETWKEKGKYDINDDLERLNGRIRF